MLPEWQSAWFHFSPFTISPSSSPEAAILKTRGHTFSCEGWWRKKLRRSSVLIASWGKLPHKHHHTPCYIKKTNPLIAKPSYFSARHLNTIPTQQTWFRNHLSHVIYLIVGETEVHKNYVTSILITLSLSGRIGWGRSSFSPPVIINSNNICHYYRPSTLEYIT